MLNNYGKFIFLFFVIVMLMMCVPRADVHAGTRKFSFKYKGISIRPGDDAAIFLKKAGSPKRIDKSASCLTDGYDYIYEYGKFALTTYTNNKSRSAIQYVSSIELKSPKVKTAEGLRVGMNERQIIKKYKKAKKKYGIYTLVKGKAKLIIIVKKKKVKYITFCNK